MKPEQKTPDLIEFKEPNNKLIFELDKFMLENKIWTFKFFIVGKRNYLLVYQNYTSRRFSHDTDLSFIIPKHLKRGDILDAFSKIELLINEIIEAKILKNEESIGEFLDILERIDLDHKIYLLKSWNLICQETFELLHKLKSVRNVLAHSWHIKNAIYGKDKTLETNFKQFQQDIKLVWSRLVNVYDFLKPQNEQLKETLKQLKRIVNQK